jgi:hypothetical protein
MKTIRVANNCEGLVEALMEASFMGEEEGLVEFQGDSLKFNRSVISYSCTINSCRVELISHKRDNILLIYNESMSDYPLVVELPDYVSNEIQEVLCELRDRK